MGITIPKWLLAIVLLLLTSGGAAVGGSFYPAEAQAVGVRCKSVQAGGYRATHVFADFMPCRSARAKLRRWLRRDRLPRKRNGWYCRRLGDGVLRACSSPGRRNARRGFTF
jgi:hypothetical protein